MELARMIELGYIRVQEHPSLPLKIYNYTDKAQMDGVWNDTTRACRGLVLDDKGKVIIKCPPKFFNLGDSFAADIDLEKAQLSEKLDGYYISIKLDSEYGLIVTSRGSFDNKYTDAARMLIPISRLGLDTTYFCELCQNFPGDESIIVAKHPIPRLVCWDAITKNGEYPKDIPFETAKRFSFSEAKKYLKGEVEGVVALDPTTRERVKIKTEWYLQRHRLISGCSKKRVWELLRAGQRIEDLSLPDEIMPQMKDWQFELRQDFKDYLFRVEHYAQETNAFSDKELGLSTEIPKDIKGLLFCLRKGRLGKCYDQIWKRIKPMV